MKRSHKRKHSKDIDYAVFMNLVIGCVAAFAVGLIITGLLFGGGLRYFSQIARENFSSRHAQAAVLSKLVIAPEPEDVRKLYQVTFSGVVDFVTPGTSPFDESIHEGTVVSGIYYFTPNVDDHMEDPMNGHYIIERQLYSVRAGNYTFAAGPYGIGSYDIWVHNASNSQSDADQINIVRENVSVRNSQDPNLVIPIQEINLDLAYSSEQFSSDELPTNMFLSPLGGSFTIRPVNGSDFFVRINSVSTKRLQ